VLASDIVQFNIEDIGDIDQGAICGLVEFEIVNDMGEVG